MVKLKLCSSSQNRSSQCGHATMLFPLKTGEKPPHRQSQCSYFYQDRQVPFEVSEFGCQCDEIVCPSPGSRAREKKQSPETQCWKEPRTFQRQCLTIYSNLELSLPVFALISIVTCIQILSLARVQHEQVLDRGFPFGQLAPSIFAGTLVIETGTPFPCAGLASPTAMT